MESYYVQIKKPILECQAYLNSLRSNFFVHDVKAKSISSTFDLGDHVSDLLDSFHLLSQVLCFQKVAKMSISFAVTSLVEIKKTLIDLPITQIILIFQ